MLLGEAHFTHVCAAHFTHVCAHVCTSAHTRVYACTHMIHMGSHLQHTWVPSYTHTREHIGTQGHALRHTHEHLRSTCSHVHIHIQMPRHRYIRMHTSMHAYRRVCVSTLTCAHIQAEAHGHNGICPAHSWDSTEALPLTLNAIRQGYSQHSPRNHSFC